MTTRDELVEVHRKHRIVKTGKPWYLQGGGDKPEGFKQVYFCKCGEWEGTHSEHEGHQMDMLIPLIEAEKAAAWDERDAAESRAAVLAKKAKDFEKEFLTADRQVTALAAQVDRVRALAGLLNIGGLSDGRTEEHAMILKDPDLPHQINLVFDQDAAVVVTCNCWKQNAKATAFKHHFGRVNMPSEAWWRYNNPANHKGDDFEPDPAMVARYGAET